jgi:hypothetical protein
MAKYLRRGAIGLLAGLASTIPLATTLGAVRRGPSHGVRRAELAVRQGQNRTLLGPARPADVAWHLSVQTPRRGI